MMDGMMMGPMMIVWLLSALAVVLVLAWLVTRLMRR
jgi:hypothetical protein